MNIVVKHEIVLVEKHAAIDRARPVPAKLFKRVAAAAFAGQSHLGAHEDDASLDGIGDQPIPFRVNFSDAFVHLGAGCLGRRARLTLRFLPTE